MKDKQHIIYTPVHFWYDFHLKFSLVKYFIYFNDIHKLYQVINLRDRREYKKYLVEVEKVKGKKKKGKKTKTISFSVLEI